MLNKKMNVLKNVVEAGSFTEAAKKLYTSQPAVSRDIKQLETEYEIQIFEETKHKLKLTAEGEVLYRYAVDMEVMNEHLINDIYQTAGEVKGDIYIGASHSFGEFVLPRILIDIHRKYPELNCHVHIGNSQDIIDHLRDKTIDIGVIEIDKTYTGIELYPLFKDEMVIMFHKSLDKESSTGQRKCFVREPYSGTRYYQETALKNKGLTPVKIEINNTELIKECVRNRMGFSILSKLAVEHENLKEIQINSTGITRNFSAAVSRGRYMSLKVQSVLDILHSNA